MVRGASAAGLKSVKSGSDGAKGEDREVAGERFEAAVKEAEVMFAEEAAIEAATKDELDNELVKTNTE